MSYATSYIPALFMIITTAYRQPFHRLTEENLSRHGQSQGKSQTAADEEKQTMKWFREEDDRYRRFLHTGDSPHQQRDQSRSIGKQESKQGKIPESLCDLVTYEIEQDRKDEA